MNSPLRSNKIPQNLPALTGLRAVAALGVLICHFSEINVDKNLYFDWGLFAPVLIHGAVGVDIFFVLSGFILAHVYRADFLLRPAVHDWRKFIRLRLARIYPVHIVTLLFMGLLFIVGRRLGTLPHHAEAFTPISIIGNFLLLQAWFPGFVSAMNGPAWSVSAEWFAYLLFPFFYLMVRPLGRIWPWLVLALAATVLWLLPMPSALALIAAEFPVGVAGYELFVARGIPTGRFKSILPIGLMLFSALVLAKTDAALLQQINTGPHLRVGIIFSSLLLIICLTNSRDMLARVLSTPWMVYGGEISYSVYMCHWSVWTILQKGLPHLSKSLYLPHWLLMSAAFLLTLCVSVFCYHAIELPGRAFIRNFGSSKATKQSSPQQAVKTAPSVLSQ